MTINDKSCAKSVMQINRNTQIEPKEDNDPIIIIKCKEKTEEKKIEDK